MARKKLGEMLIEAGVLDEDRLRAALADQRKWGRSLGRTLVEMKILDEDVLVRVLAQQLGLESVELDRRAIPADVVALIPEELARSAKVVAFARELKFLDVAITDPSNVGLIDELRIRTQLNIRPYLAGPRQIERAIERCYGGSGDHHVDISFDMPDTPVATMPVAAASGYAGEQGGLALGRPGRPIRPTRPTATPPLPSASKEAVRDAEIDALQGRISRLEALVARDEDVLRRLLSLLVDKGLATHDEIRERLT